ncbi:hypothetical protein, partial [Streptomyces sp. NPDC005568]|uniref:hypothetical protein n=1 Tax=Streptomyces sp. NPDC005568 TaxID=3156887 RepID=UPI0033BE53C6
VTEALHLAHMTGLSRNDYASLLQLKLFRASGVLGSGARADAQGSGLLTCWAPGLGLTRRVP